MNILEDIDRVTQLPSQSNNFQFIPRDNRTNKDYPWIERKGPSPRGPGKQLIALDMDSSDDEKNIEENTSFNKITMITGNAYDNFSIENRVKQKQREAEEKQRQTECSESSGSFMDLSISSFSSTSTASKTSDSYKSLKNSLSDNALNNDAWRNRYFRNAAIVGLLNNNKITLGDLGLADKEATKDSSSRRNNKKRNSAKSRNDKSNNIADYQGVEVLHPEDNDVIVNALQINGAREHPDIDYTVERLGVKKVTSAKEFFMSVKDDDFAFKKCSP